LQNGFAGKTLFEKRLSHPHPISQKLLSYYIPVLSLSNRKRLLLTPF